MRAVFYLVALLHFVISAEISPDVIGGMDAEKAKYEDAPWIVSLQMYEEDFAYCGATLIRKPEQIANLKDENKLCTSWAVTAASCLEGVPNKIATLGNLKLKDKDIKEAQLTIIESVTHENYSEVTRQNDITLLKVHFETEDECDTFPHLDINPPSGINETLYDFINATVFGWGLLTENGPLQKELYKVPVPLLTDQACATLYGHEVFDGNTMICAGDANHAPCSHDTGGPLLCEYTDPTGVNPPVVYLCGIASFGTSCRVPAVFADVKNFVNWIDQTMNENSD